MLRRMMRSRGMRKFIQNRFAMLALFVIGIYLAAALAVGFTGIISPADFNNRWGPNLLQASFAQPSLEERFSYADWYMEVPEAAMGVVESSPEDARESLSSINFFGLKPVTGDPLAFKALYDVAKAEFEQLSREFEDLAPAEGLEGMAADASLASRKAAILERFVPLEAKIKGLLSVAEGEGGMRGVALWLGTDRQGRSIWLRGLYSIKVAIQIGLVSALISVLIGTFLGGLAGFYGGMVDSVVVWLYSTFSAIPYIVLLMVLAASFLGSPFEGTLFPVYVAFCSTFWIGPCRVIRGEVMKLREQEFVQAATALGLGRMRILMKHILPNTTHLMFINFSLLFIGAIKAEVILSFLNLGVKNQPSWGLMISHSQPQVVTGFMWQIGTATVLMFCLVYAFNILSDALQDAFDPKHV